MATMAMASIAEFPLVQREGVAEVAARILTAWRNGESSDLIQELAQMPLCTTLEMEKMEVLSAAVESLGHVSGKHAGALRLLEHLAAGAPREIHFSVVN
jgi:hypothetical protein